MALGCLSPGEEVTMEVVVVPLAQGGWPREAHANSSDHTGGSPNVSNFLPGLTCLPHGGLRSRGRGGHVINLPVFPIPLLLRRLNFMMIRPSTTFKKKRSHLIHLFLLIWEMVFHSRQLLIKILKISKSLLLYQFPRHLLRLSPLLDPMTPRVPKARRQPQRLPLKPTM